MFFLFFCSFSTYFTNYQLRLDTQIRSPPPRHIQTTTKRDDECSGGGHKRARDASQTRLEPQVSFSKFVFIKCTNNYLQLGYYNDGDDYEGWKPRPRQGTAGIGVENEGKWKTGGLDTCTDTYRTPGTFFLIFFFALLTIIYRLHTNERATTTTIVSSNGTSTSTSTITITCNDTSQHRHQQRHQPATATAATAATGNGNGTSQQRPRQRHQPAPAHHNQGPRRVSGLVFSFLFFFSFFFTKTKAETCLGLGFLFYFYFFYFYLFTRARDVSGPSYLIFFHHHRGPRRVSGLDFPFFIFFIYSLFIALGVYIYIYYY